MTSIELAAWVQAVGSILAIGAGFGLYFIQQRAAVAAKYAALHAVLAMARGYSRGLVEMTQSHKSQRRDRWLTHLRGVQKNLRSIGTIWDRIDYSPLSSQETWHALASFSSSYDSLMNTIEAGIDVGQQGPGVVPVQDEEADIIGQQAARFYEMAELLTSTLPPDKLEPRRIKRQRARADAAKAKPNSG